MIALVKATDAHRRLTVVRCSDDVVPTLLLARRSTLKIAFFFDSLLNRWQTMPWTVCTQSIAPRCADVSPVKVSLDWRIGQLFAALYFSLPFQLKLFGWDEVRSVSAGQTQGRLRIVVGGSSITVSK